MAVAKQRSAAPAASIKIIAKKSATPKEELKNMGTIHANIYHLQKAVQLLVDMVLSEKSGSAEKAAATDKPAPAKDAK